MRRAAIAALSVIAGCGGSQPLDVCAGRANCLAVHVAGSGAITTIDQIGVSVSGAIKVDAKDPMSAGGAIDLPVALAILYPQGRNGLVEVKATGFLDGRDIGEGSTSGQVVAGGNSSVSITLTAPSNGDQSVLVDGGVQDLAGRDTSTPIPDMVGTDFSLIDFAGGKDFAIPVDMTVLPDLSHPDLTPPPPILTSVTPPSGPTNGGTAFTISGDNFVNGATVTIDNLPVFGANVVDAKTITGVTPPDQNHGKVAVTVRNPDGQSATGMLFTYYFGNVNFNNQGMALNQWIQTGRALAAADFTNDGILDLVVTGQGKINVQSNVMLRGNGNGNFTAMQGFGQAPSGHSVVAFDVDRDGNTDAVVGYTAALIGVLTNQNGQLGNGPTYPVLGNGAPQKVARGDFNADGFIDVAIADAATDTMGIYLNVNGMLAPEVTYAVNGEAWSLAAGDFDKNGDLDLAVCGITANNVQIFFGKGNGNFNGAKVYSTGMTPHDVAVGDFDGDGWPDLVVTLNSGQGVDTLLNDGAGGFKAAVVHPGGVQPSDVVVADFDLNGALDFANTSTQEGAVFVSLGNGDGSFAAPIQMNGAPQLMGLVAADLDNDGKIDIASVGQQQLVVMINRSK
jgi:hypothetical protein